MLSEGVLAVQGEDWRIAIFNFFQSSYLSELMRVPKKLFRWLVSVGLRVFEVLKQLQGTGFVLAAWSVENTFCELFHGLRQLVFLNWFFTVFKQLLAFIHTYNFLCSSLSLFLSLSLVAFTCPIMLFSIQAVKQHFSFKHLIYYISYDAAWKILLSRTWGIRNFAYNDAAM